jgi:hypothetical protein
VAHCPTAPTCGTNALRRFSSSSSASFDNCILYFWGVSERLPTRPSKKTSQPISPWAQTGTLP